MILDQFPLADNAGETLLLILTAPEGFECSTDQTVREQLLRDRFLLRPDWDLGDYEAGVRYMMEKGWVNRAAARLQLSSAGYEASKNLSICFAH
jgi:hypothetical protein